MIAVKNRNAQFILNIILNELIPPGKYKMGSVNNMAQTRMWGIILIDLE
jgi:hypothetical protein